MKKKQEKKKEQKKDSKKEVKKRKNDTHAASEGAQFRAQKSPNPQPPTPNPTPHTPNAQPNLDLGRVRRVTYRRDMG